MLVESTKLYFFMTECYLYFIVSDLEVSIVAEHCTKTLGLKLIKNVASVFAVVSSVHGS